MSRLSQRISNIKPSTLFLWVAILVGGYIRLSGVLESPLPYNDGGLFFSMTRDLIANGFRLPEFTSYNHLNIPFAYPPLPFYFTGLLSSLTGWDLLDIFRILPAVFAVLTIPAFFLLARELLKDDLQVAFAVLMFAFIPSSFTWLIMGGGITRAPAFFLALLTLVSIHRLYTRKEVKYIFITALLASLTILTHPETALHTAAAALVFLLFFGRNKRGILRSLIVAGITITLTSPWWGTVIARHGFTPFLAAGQRGWHGYESTLELLLFPLTNELFFHTLAVLGMIGLFWYLARRSYFLPVLFLVIFFSETRSAPLFVSPLIAIFAAFTLTNLLPLFIRTNGEHIVRSPETNPLKNRVALIFFALLFLQLMIFSTFTARPGTKNTASLDPVDLSAFEWIKENTPPQSRFLVLSGREPLTDPQSEWFPALTDRVSVGTVQGHEWLENTNFDDLLENQTILKDCHGQGLKCLNAWSALTENSYDYIYLQKYSPAVKNKESNFTTGTFGVLIQSTEFSLVYDQDHVSIFVRK